MINPIAFSIFWIDIKWYGISYVISFIIGDFLLNYYINKYKEINVTLEEKNNYFTYLLLGILFGGRIGNFLFYGPILDLFSLELFNIRNGGMSFYGAFLGVHLSIYLFCYFNNKNFFNLSDLIVLPVPIGLFLGRLANYINGEIEGLDIWIFRDNIVLFESFFEGILLFFILNYNKNFSKKGHNSFKFMLFYGVFRTIIEIFKPSDGILNLHISLIMSFLMIFVSSIYFLMFA